MKLKQGVFIKKSFTLVEILTVIAVIGILAVIVVVSVSRARDKAREARMKTILSEYKLQLTSDARNTGNYSLLTDKAGSFANTGEKEGKYQILEQEARDINAVDICQSCQQENCNCRIAANLGENGYKIWLKFPSNAHYLCMDYLGNITEGIDNPGKNEEQNPLQCPIDAEQVK